MDEVLRTPTAGLAVGRYGRPAAVDAVRRSLAAARTRRTVPASADAVAADAVTWLDADAQPNLRPVFNLTGTVLHTNLGRAILAEAAIEAAVVAMRQAVALEFDLATGRRGERDDHLRGLLCELTGRRGCHAGQQQRRGRSARPQQSGQGTPGHRVARRADRNRRRLPPARRSCAGRAKLAEVGTTNRTHLQDYAGAIGQRRPG